MENKTPPFCKNCAYFVPAAKDDQPRCRKFQLLDVVMGEPFFVPCSHVREKGAPCDTDGKLFQPQPLAGVAGSDSGTTKPASN
jgi:hypothetical protein